MSNVAELQARAHVLHAWTRKWVARFGSLSAADQKLVKDELQAKLVSGFRVGDIISLNQLSERIRATGTRE
jgi:hypothetical protein